MLPCVEVPEVALDGEALPLEDLVESVLLALLVSDIVAVGGLLVELSQGVGGLLEAHLQRIQMDLITTRCVLLGRLLLLGSRVAEGLLVSLIERLVVVEEPVFHISVI